MSLSMKSGNRKLKHGMASVNQQPCNIRGEIVEVSLLKEAGLEYTTEVIYVSKGVARTWNFLEEGHQIMALLGPPGVGKSTSGV